MTFPSLRMHSRFPWAPQSPAVPSNSLAAPFPRYQQKHRWTYERLYDLAFAASMPARRYGMHPHTVPIAPFHLVAKVAYLAATAEMELDVLDPHNFQRQCQVQLRSDDWGMASL